MLALDCIEKWSDFAFDLEKDDIEKWLYEVVDMES